MTTTRGEAVNVFRTVEMRLPCACLTFKVKLQIIRWAKCIKVWINGPQCSFSLVKTNKPKYICALEQTPTHLQIKVFQ